MAQRYKVVFDSAEAVDAALAIETPGAQPVVVNRKRHYISVTGLERPGRPSALAAVDAAGAMAAAFNARVVEDFQYQLEPPPDAERLQDVFVEAAADSASASLDDVVAQVRADKAWARTRGGGVTIAVVDTGVDGTRPEFPDRKRAGSWQPVGDAPWTDWEGHGSMCACIAAGTRADGGAFDGIAPDAGIMACRTRFFDSELTAVYDELIARADNGETVVATNSFGLRTGTPPSPPPDSDFPDALAEAVAAGVHVFFSAGNYHELAGGAPAACSPTSIWLYKSRDDLMAVATCKLDGPMWFYSSRGPGQHFGGPGANRKPDVTAPTPENGRVVYGSTVRTLANGWGTSGACPQAAGLAALLLALDPSLSAAEVRSIIRDSADDLGHGLDCQGAGRINCEAAVARLLTA